MATSWHSFDLATGLRGAPLQTSKLGTVSRIIGEATDTTIDVAIADAGGVQMPGWRQATTPGRTLLAALDGPDERIIWGGMTLRRSANAGSTVQAALATLEHYFKRRYVGDLTYLGTDQGQICAGIIGSIAVEGLGFTIDAPASTQLRDRMYRDVDDKTVDSVLSELSGVLGGPEWTVDLEWTSTDHTQLRYVYRVRDRLGVTPTDPVRFTMPGCVVDFSFIEDYTDGHGANDCVTTSTGAGTTNPDGSQLPKPYSSHHRNTALLGSGMPRYESRRTPSTSIVDIATLDAAAEADLQQMQYGLAQLSLTANLDAAPRINADWRLGDDIAVELTCPRFPATDPAKDPNGEAKAGLRVVTRATGWTADLDQRVLAPTILGVLNG